MGLHLAKRLPPGIAPEQLESRGIFSSCLIGGAIDNDIFDCFLNFVVERAEFDKGADILPNTNVFFAAIAVEFFEAITTFRKYNRQFSEQ